jgi:hypothetical protein
VGTGGATGGHNAAGSSAPGAAGQSGNVPSNHHVNLSLRNISISSIIQLNLIIENRHPVIRLTEHFQLPDRLSFNSSFLSMKELWCRPHLTTVSTCGTSVKSGRT